ncbi:MAG: hypothetical protein D6812_03240, partial [Deltaproteobacteria bacterium]
TLDADEAIPLPGIDVGNVPPRPDLSVPAAGLSGATEAEQPHAPAAPRNIAVFVTGTHEGGEETWEPPLPVEVLPLDPAAPDRFTIDLSPFQIDRETGEVFLYPELRASINALSGEVAAEFLPPEANPPGPSR